MGVILHKKQNYSGVSPYKYVPITTANYNALPQSEKMDSTKVYFLIDAKVASARIDDTDTSIGKVWSSKKVSDEIDAVQDQVDNNTADITTLNGKFPKLIASATGDGVKTYGQLFNTMFASITPNPKSMYILNNNDGTEIYTSVTVQPNQIRLSYCYTASTGTNYNASATLSASSSFVNVYFSGSGNTKAVSNATSTVVASGLTLKLFEIENVFA